MSERRHLGWMRLGTGEWVWLETTRGGANEQTELLENKTLNLNPHTEKH